LNGQAVESCDVGVRVRHRSQRFGTDNSKRELEVYDWADDEVSTMLFGKAIDHSQEVDAVALTREEMCSSTARGRLSGALAGQL